MDEKIGDGIMMPKRDQLGGGRPVPETGKTNHVN